MSILHLRYHEETLHSIPCPHEECDPVCELKCIEMCAQVCQVSHHIQTQVKCINGLEKALILEGIGREVSDEDLKKKLRGAVLRLDLGMNDGNLEELCKLAYLPSWANLKTYQNQYLTAASEWIRNEEYITSLDKQVQDASSSSIYE